MPAFHLSHPARKSLKFIARYTEREWGRPQREKYIATLVARFKKHARAPETGKSCDHLRQGLRSSKSGKPLIFYVRHGQDIVIAEILHENMDIQRRIEDWT